MNAERRQGLIFACFACVAAAAAGTLGRFPPQLELIILAALILVLGVPHGAMDTLFAQRLYGPAAVVARAGPAKMLLSGPTLEVATGSTR